ncbi:MAG: hypothetical protein OXF88_21975 [Rhodobacteraceae bacterium]|nr:hypothetical protein [Paracoccaceae bacterium]MCY4138352.1 hypothetical protein [Paracoccaceae bacterium]
MISFIPATSANREACFPHPDVCLDDSKTNPGWRQVQKGPRAQYLPLHDTHSVGSLVARVRNAGLGTHAEMPERSKG